MCFFFFAVLGLHCCLGFSPVTARGPLSSPGAWAPHCGSLSYCRAWALGAPGCSSGSSWTPRGLVSFVSWAPEP